MPTLPSGYKQWKEAVLTLGRNQEVFEGRMRSRHVAAGNGDRKTPRGVTHDGRGLPMEIDAQSPNWSNDGKPKCFNCNKYGHMGKDCRLPKKKKIGTNGGTKKFDNSKGNKEFECFNCGTKGHYAKNCRKPKKDRGKQRQVEADESEESDQEETEEEEQGFLEGSD